MGSYPRAGGAQETILARQKSILVPEGNTTTRKIVG